MNPCLEPSSKPHGPVRKNKRKKKACLGEEYLGAPFCEYAKTQNKQLRKSMTVHWSATASRGHCSSHDEKDLLNTVELLTNQADQYPRSPLVMFKEFPG
jgi:hypothetical protein